MQIIKRLFFYFILAFAVIPIFYAVLILILEYFIKRTSTIPNYSTPKDLTFNFTYTSTVILSYVSWWIFLIFIIYDYALKFYRIIDEFPEPKTKFIYIYFYIFSTHIFALFAFNLITDLFHNGYEFMKALILTLVGSLLLSSSILFIYEKQKSLKKNNDTF